MLILFCLGFFLFSLHTPATGTATLQDYWDGKAEWKFRNKLTLGNISSWQQNYNPNINYYGYGGGNVIQVLGDTWYMFGVSLNWGDVPTECMYHNESQTLSVRKSTDKGYTWSAPIQIYDVKNSKWRCGLADGDAYYSEEENRWYLISQCKTGGTPNWDTCLFYRDGNEAYGIFKEFDGGNPIIKHDEIWDQICNSEADDCVKFARSYGSVVFNKTVQDAGTIDIVEKKNGYYYISFHGYDGRFSYRGLAKSSNWKNWIAGSSADDLPDDSFLDASNQMVWRERWVDSLPVGFGAARTIYEDGYYYTLSEGMDIDLACTSGQNWDWGIFRSKTLKNVNWEQYPQGNPILYSRTSNFPEKDINTGKEKISSCNPAYGGIFRDRDGRYYLQLTRVTQPNTGEDAYNGVYIFELVDTNNLLKNSDYWKCTSDNWNRLNGASQTTNWVVNRDPNNSSDEVTCYMVTNCGGSSCQTGQSIYQDIFLDESLRSNLPSMVKFGGKISSPEATNVSGMFDLFEIDSSGNILNSHQLIASGINSVYKNFESKVQLNAKTAHLRFAFYLTNPVNYRLDELYISPVQNLCNGCEIVGDADCDNKFTLRDFSQWYNGYKSQSGNNGDFNCDGKTSIEDFSLWFNSFKNNK